MHGNAKKQVSNSGHYKQTQKKKSKTCEDNYIYLMSHVCNQLGAIIAPLLLADIYLQSAVE